MNLFSQGNKFNIFDNKFEDGEGVKTLSLFFTYLKTKENPNGNPIPKQSVRESLMFKRNYRVIKKIENINGKDVEVKYYPIEDLYINHYQPAAITKNTEHIQAQAKKFVQMTNLVKPFDKNISIDALMFVFSPIASLRKKDIEIINNGGYVLKNTKPDMIDNLPKLLFDGLNKIIISDDARICRENNVYKVYGKTPGVFLKIRGEL